MILYGFDGGLAKFGWCRMEVSAPGLANLTAGGVHVTERDSAKRHVLEEEDIMVRCTRLASFLFGQVQKDIPVAHGDPKLVFAMEAMSYPPSARGAVMLGMSLATIGTIASLYNVPIVQASPQTIKLAVAGKRGASKKEVEDAVRAKFPHSATLIADTIHPKNHEHFFDSVAAAMVGMTSNIAKAAM